jgi:hypothetical protein
MFNLDYSIVNSKYNFYKNVTIAARKAQPASLVFRTTLGTRAPVTVTVTSQ